MDKIYLGDGVYAEFDGFYVRLFTSDGIHQSTVICIDDCTADALIAYIRKCFKLEEK